MKAKRGKSMLEFNIIKTDGSDSDIDFYNKTYQMWKEVWTETYNQLEGVTSISSDQFLLNQYCGVISFEGEPIACWLMSFFDGSLQPFYDRSYLVQYPSNIVKDEIQRLSAKNICLYNNITVSRNSRRQNNQLPCSIAWLQFSLAIKFYEYCQADVLFGYCRNEKKVNSMASCHGAIRLETSVRHNVEVDYMSIPIENVKYDVSWDVKSNAVKLFENYLTKDQTLKKVA